MYEVSEAYKAAIRDSTRRFRYSGEITDKNGIKHTFTNEDIVKGSGYITNQCCGSGEIELGGVYAAELGITLYNTDIDRYALKNGTISMNFFLELADGTWEEVPLGVFDITEANRTINCLEIVAYDHMLRFEKNFNNTVSSGTPYDFLYYACYLCEVELAHTKEEIESWDNGKVTLGVYSENDIETWRDVIYYTAQVLGCFCTINRKGQLELRKFTSEPVRTIESRHRFTSSFSDFITRYSAISVTNLNTGILEYYALDPDDALTMKLGNQPLMQFGLDETREAVARAILNMIAAINYVPFDSDTIGDPAFDLGDVIQFTGGHADENQYTCITKYEYRINGKHSLQCVGRNPRLSDSKSKTDKNISGLINSIEADKVAVKVFINTAVYNIGTEDVEIAYIEFASGENTDAQFNASIVIDVAADQVTKTGSVTIPDTDEEGNVTDTTYEVTLPDDGEAVVTVKYVWNGYTVTTFYPVETLHSGRHTISLYYPLAGLALNTLNTFAVLMNVSGGAVTIDRGNVISTISGQGLAANSGWDGRIAASDSMELVDIGGGMAVVGINDTMTQEMQKPATNALVAVISGISGIGFGGIAIAGISDSLTGVELIVSDSGTGEEE